MIRFCSACRRQFVPADFVKEESRGMEVERRELGLEGVRFLYYSCQECGHDEIFVDLVPLDGESPDEFERRRSELEAAVQAFAERPVEVVLTTR